VHTIFFFSKEDSKIMISDFGLSKIASEPETMPAMQTACGTPGYVGELRSIIIVQINMIFLHYNISNFSCTLCHLIRLCSSCVHVGHLFGVVQSVFIVVPVPRFYSNS